MSLTQNAVIVSLKIRQWTNLRDDKSITEGVKTLHKLTGKAGVWKKYKVNEKRLKPTRSAATMARQKHYELTVSWEEGSRLLPLANRELYHNAMMELKATFDTAADGFAADYPSIIEEARTMHNGTFNEADYPSDPRSLFGISWEYSPVPDESHFVKSLRSEMADQLREANERRVQSAIADLWARVLEPVQHMAETLADKKAVFRDTLVTNVQQVVNLIPALNFTNDPRLKSATDQIAASLASLDANMLRENKVVRRTAAEAAGAIVKTFGSLGQRKLA